MLSYVTPHQENKGVPCNHTTIQITCTSKLHFVIQIMIMVMSIGISGVKMSKNVIADGCIMEILSFMVDADKMTDSNINRSMP